MITYFVAFLVALMVGTVMTLVVRNRAHAWGLLDRANSSRKIHTAPIPRLGGIAIVAGFFAPLTGLLLVDSGVGEVFKAHPSLIGGLFVGGLAIAALGLYDDLRGAGARLKFAVQFLVAIGLYVAGFRIEQIANPFGPTLTLGLASLPLTVIWVVGVVNALNLIDGLDGLAGGVAFFGVATNFILAFARGDILMSLLMAALAGAVLGFLVFNFNPASIFMGDTGSMFLGFVLAAVSLKTSSKSGTAVAMLVPIISLGLPIMDTLLAMVRRSLMGRPMFSADKEHIHHRLMSRLVMSHRQAVLALYGLCCLFALTALGLSYANSAQSAMLLLCVGTVVFVLMRKLGYLSLKDAGVVSQMRKRNIQLRTLVRHVIEDIHNARTVAETWSALRPLSPAMDMARIEFQLEMTTDPFGLHDRLSFEAERKAGTALPLEVRLDVRFNEHRVGTLIVSWRDGRAVVDRDEELALELVADTLGEVCSRLMTPPQGARVLPFKK